MAYATSQVLLWKSGILLSENGSRDDAFVPPNKENMESPIEVLRRQRISFAYKWNLCTFYIFPGLAIK